MGKPFAQGTFVWLVPACLLSRHLLFKHRNIDLIEKVYRQE